MTSAAIVSVGKLAETLGRLGFAEDVRLVVGGTFGGIYHVDMLTLERKKIVYTIACVDHKWWTRTW